MVFVTRPVISGVHGVVSAGHYLASATGLHVLQQGGNAVDAGVAAGFAVSVVKPHECGMGGEAPILIRMNREGAKPVAISGQGGAPQGLTSQWLAQHRIDAIPGDGLLPATVPAAFSAWVTALRDYGTRTLAETLGPAVALARDGFALYPHLRNYISRAAPRLRAEWPTTAAMYLDHGDVPDVGWLIKAPEWAETFAGIIRVEQQAKARGREAALNAAIDHFYRGPIASKLAAFAGSTDVLDATGRAHRGFLSVDDFAAHETRIEAPVKFRYRGIDVYKCGPWSQGPVFLQQLALLEAFDLKALGHNTVDYIHALVEMAKLAFADRDRYYGDPRFTDVPLDQLLSTAYASQRRRSFDRQVASAGEAPGAIGQGTQVGRDGDSNPFTGDTTHVDVIDGAGNMISATPSGGWLQSSPVVPGVGFPLGTRAEQFSRLPDHPNSVAPGKRPRTTLSPSLTVRNEEPYMVFGTPGGDIQDQVTLQFFLNVVEFGMNLQEAIDAPVFHIEHFASSFYPHEAHPRRVVVEGRISPQTRQELTKRGHDVVVEGDWSLGDTMAVRFSPTTGLIEGAASPRRMCAYAIGY